ncbi:MAG: Spy/CpxP family protein refolding chaperone [Gemmatimonadetes bacterium]|nr:Spy/CpxP family protein refolding chaperone [Gemmatimonadota bacterium]
MKKVISGVIAGTLSIVLLTWAFDALGRTGHEDGGHQEPAAADADHGQPDAVNETAEDSDADFAEGRFARTRLSRSAMARLEVTDDQQEKIKALRSAYTREMIQLRADSRLARVELRELMDEASPDVDRVKELAAAVSAARGSVFERSAIFRAEFRNVLTPEQQETLRESFRDRRDGRRDSGMRWRRGGRESRNRR